VLPSNIDAGKVVARIGGDHYRDVSHVRQHVERRLTGCGHLILPFLLVAVGLDHGQATDRIRRLSGIR
jgi:hypothetical protein